ncbi:7138_t:CDS:2 [Dentiscutata heterogama]|uniref:7138_t:CDS:1 n=1 Tax=Dentiscutata heterogama TaxID=1316150 RepID=A0ACA9K052_9GLOM|nr:7138_t:CDS:2 [Dentiscutata heterogama]
MNLNSILESINSVEKDDEDKFYENLYEILGCTSSCTTEQISTEYKKRALNCHPDKVKDKVEKAKKEFYQLSTAYNILADETERSQYDKWRTGSIKIPYKMWKEMVMKKGHTVHWTSPPKQPLKITDSLDTSSASQTYNNDNTRVEYNAHSYSKFRRKHRQDDLYEKFRNYEI